MLRRRRARRHRPPKRSRNKTSSRTTRSTNQGGGRTTDLLNDVASVLSPKRMGAVVLVKRVKGATLTTRDLIGIVKKPTVTLREKYGDIEVDLRR